MSTTINGDESYSLLMYDKGTSIHTYIYVVRTTDRASNILLFTNRYRCIPCSTEASHRCIFFANRCCYFGCPCDRGMNAHLHVTNERTNEQQDRPTGGRTGQPRMEKRFFACFDFWSKMCTYRDAQLLWLSDIRYVHTRTYTHTHTYRTNVPVLNNKIIFVLVPGVI